MAKRSLNLYLDEASIARGERYSERHRTSVSKLVDAFLSHLPEEAEAAKTPLPPTLKRLVGVARGPVDGEDYREYLREKYGA